MTTSDAVCRTLLDLYVVQGFTIAEIERTKIGACATTAQKVLLAAGVAIELQRQPKVPAVKVCPQGHERPGVLTRCPRCIKAYSQEYARRRK